MAIVLRSGPWSAEEVGVHLRASVIPIRLATAGRTGTPLVQSLWYQFRDDALWCATQEASLVARRIARNPAVGFEVAADAPPYAGVRGTGRAEVRSEGAAELLRELIVRYLGDDTSALARRLLGRADTEVVLRIGALEVSSWDFRERMSAG